MSLWTKNPFIVVNNYTYCKYCAPKKKRITKMNYELKVGTILSDENLGKIAKITYKGGKRCYHLELLHPDLGTFAYDVSESTLKDIIQEYDLITLNAENNYSLTIPISISINLEQQTLFKDLQNQVYALEYLSDALRTSCNEPLALNLLNKSRTLQNTLNELIKVS